MSYLAHSDGYSAQPAVLCLMTLVDRYDLQTLCSQELLCVADPHARIILPLNTIEPSNKHR